MALQQHQAVAIGGSSSLLSALALHLLREASPLVAAPSPQAELGAALRSAEDSSHDDHDGFRRCFVLRFALPRDWDFLGGLVSGVLGTVVARVLVRVRRVFEGIGEYFGDEQDIPRPGSLPTRGVKR